MQSQPLPVANQVTELVSMLVGKPARAVTCSPLAVPAARGVATYIDREGTVLYVALIDMAFLAGVGAALAMIPPTLVAEAIKSGKPSEMIVENAYEVMNILASLYNDAEGEGSHVKIERLVVTPPVPPPLALRLAKPKARRDFEVQLPGYPSGKLTLLAVT